MTPDRIKNSRRWLAVLLVACFFCAFHGKSAAAQTITIAQNQQLRFGVLQVPASGSHTRTVSTAGATSGTGIELLSSPAAQAGQFTLSCSASCTGSWNITINATNVVTGNAALSIGSWTGNYIGVPINIPSSGNPKCNSAKTLLLGATATYTSAIPEGAYTPTYDVVVTTP
jgi:hypothetical protein